MTGGTDFLTRSEMQKFKDEQQQSMFTPGGLFTTALLPGIAEIRGQVMLGEMAENRFTRFFGMGARADMITNAAGLKPTDLKAIVDNDIEQIRNNNQKRKHRTRRKGTRAGFRNRPMALPTARAKLAKADPLLRQARALKGFARGVGMAELIKIGADLGGMAIDSVMGYRSAPKSIKLSTGPGFFNDTRAAQTQRQRAIQAIHNSQLTTRAALGNEAAFLHI